MDVFEKMGVPMSIIEINPRFIRMANAVLNYISITENRDTSTNIPLEIIGSVYNYYRFILNDESLALRKIREYLDLTLDSACNDLDSEFAFDCFVEKYGNKLKIIEGEDRGFYNIYVILETEGDIIELADVSGAIQSDVRRVAIRHSVNKLRELNE